MGKDRYHEGPTASREVFAYSSSLTPLAR